MCDHRYHDGSFRIELLVLSSSICYFYLLVLEYFHHPKRKTCTQGYYCLFSLTPYSLLPSFSLSVWICLFQTFHISRIIYVSFCVWISLSIFLGFIYVTAYISIPLFFLQPKNIQLYGYTTAHQLMKTWVISSFWLLMDNAVKETHYKFLCGHRFSILLNIYLGEKLLCVW